MHEIRRYGFRPIALGTVIILLLLIPAPTVVFAEEAPTPPEAPISATVKILAKGNNFIVTSEHHFIVTKKTAIRDLSGRTIKLSELPVPCDAQITYQIGPDQTPFCLAIKLQRIYMMPE